MELLELKLVFGLGDDRASSLRHSHSCSIFGELPLDPARLVISRIDQGDAAVVDGGWRKSVFVLLLCVGVDSSFLNVSFRLEEAENPNSRSHGQNQLNNPPTGQVKTKKARTMFAPSTTSLFRRLMTFTTLPVFPLLGPEVMAT